MPSQMGWPGGEVRSMQKSQGIHVAETYAPDAVWPGDAWISWFPDCCIVDMATIIHQASPRAAAEGGGRSRPPRTWNEYHRHLVFHFVCMACARGGSVKEVILCFDKRKYVPPIKAFAHAKRFSMSQSNEEGSGRHQHKYGAGSNRQARGGVLPARPSMPFHMDDETPTAQEWG